MAAGLGLVLGAGPAPGAAIVDLSERAVTARQAARKALLDGLQSTDSAYRFELFVVYVPKGSIPGIGFDFPVNHIRYDSALFFGFDQDSLRPGADRIIRDFAEVIARDGGLRSVLVVGHTDSVGPDAYNIDLAERRAQTVFRRLKALGVDEDILGIVPIGEAQPLLTNSTAEGRAQNRRVEFFISDDMAASLQVIVSREVDPCLRNDHGVVEEGSRPPCTEGGEQVRVMLGHDAEGRQPTQVIKVGDRSAIATPEPGSRPPIPMPELQRPPLPVIRPSAEPGG
jgi:outer membrane protein OmpA-like peptidoglycan-associated protein